MGTILHPSVAASPSPARRTPQQQLWGIKSLLQAPRLQSGRIPWICSVPSPGTKEEPAPSRVYGGRFTPVQD